MTMLSYAVKVAGILSLMRWHVLRFDGPLLAYSDHPVVLWPMNIERTRPFSRLGLGPLTMLEICVPIAPDAAILMNWIDRSDEVGVAMKPRAAVELNAFTVSQAEKEWMHRPGSEPEIADDVFSPLSRLIDPAYDRTVAKRSARRMPRRSTSVPEPANGSTRSTSLSRSDRSRHFRRPRRGTWAVLGT